MVARTAEGRAFRILTIPFIEPESLRGEWIYRVV
jgi:MoxR-like ATPase